MSIPLSFSVGTSGQFFVRAAPQVTRSRNVPELTSAAQVVESATAWMNLSLVQRALGRLEESEASRKRALQLDPLAGTLRATILALEGQVAKGEKAPLEATLKPGAGEEVP